MIAVQSFEGERDGSGRSWAVEGDAFDDCPVCSSVCASCGRSAHERGGARVLCDGMCRDCVEWDFAFDAAAGAWLMVDRHGECDDCDRDAALFSIGDGLVCFDCLRPVRRKRAAA